jgi:hypothetical protein
MERRCPHCMEPVPSNSINCPACFKQIPRNEPAASREHGYEMKRKDGRTALLLSLIPAAFGAMGLGLIYLGDERKGLRFLIVGIPLMILMVLLLMSLDGSFGRTILSLGLLILSGLLFTVLFAAQLLMTVAASVR